MDPEYLPYYSAALEGWLQLTHDLAASEFVGPVDDFAEVRDAVAAASAQLSPGRALRADAQLFLVLNFWQMIVAPVRQVRGGEIDRTELFDDVRTDAMSLAAAAAVQTPEAEVSAHAVVDALGEQWDDLRVARWQLWE